MAKKSSSVEQNKNIFHAEMAAILNTTANQKGAASSNRKTNVPMDSVNMGYPLEQSPDSRFSAVGYFSVKYPNQLKQKTVTDLNFAQGQIDTIEVLSIRDGSSMSDGVVNYRAFETVIDAPITTVKFGKLKTADTQYFRATFIVESFELFANNDLSDAGGIEGRTLAINIESENAIELAGFLDHFKSLNVCFLTKRGNYVSFNLGGDQSEKK